ncbi:glycosyltransferase family 4 protein [Halobacillus litoralis]|uniref:glycosyltransferase family 4 protein n=1 Tax=Halobacillus litoralis TaxID=45668 RepID=UPI001CFD8066|nr:glycosyltransferase family 4 protein [Halobacillus litoralis]WLR49048.1 glycosyltransferase family 4 protein [Halobacillus litoralis]
MKKILIVANHYITVYAFRRELVKKLIENDYKVYLSLPKSEENQYFKELGCEIIESPMDRRGTNPISELKLFMNYIKTLKAIVPDLVLTYTIKPNIYAGIAAKLLKVKTIHTVTGLGSVYIQNMYQKSLIAKLNKVAFKSASRVIFLNEDNKKFYHDMKIISKNQKTSIVPGSGVNLDKFKHKKLPSDNKIRFTFVARVLKDKGIEEFLHAAKSIVENYNNVEFEVVGFVDEERYVKFLAEYEQRGFIKYLGKRSDIPEIMEKTSCIVLPSYGEGRGTVLQEGAAIGRPLITCDTYGCRENVEEGYNGYLCEVANPESLKSKLEKFINLSHEEKVKMGNRSRVKAEKEFNRSIVIETYLNEIDKITKS